MATPTTAPGMHLYFDEHCPEDLQDDCGLLVHVTIMEGDRVARVCHPDDEDAGIELPVDALQGHFEPVTGITRPWRPRRPQ